MLHLKNTAPPAARKISSLRSLATTALCLPSAKPPPGRTPKKERLSAKSTISHLFTMRPPWRAIRAPLQLVAPLPRSVFCYEMLPPPGLGQLRCAPHLHPGSQTASKATTRLCGHSRPPLPNTVLCRPPRRALYSSRLSRAHSQTPPHQHPKQLFRQQRPRSRSQRQPQRPLPPYTAGCLL